MLPEPDFCPYCTRLVTASEDSVRPTTPALLARATTLPVYHAVCWNRVLDGAPGGPLGMELPEECEAAA